MLAPRDILGLLILAFALLGAGVPRTLHDHLEHRADAPAAHDHAGCSGHGHAHHAHHAAAEPHDAPRDADLPVAPEDDGTDHCGLCLLLAVMKLAPLPPPTPAGAPAPFLHVVALRADVVPAATGSAPREARGPPTLS